MSVPSVLLTPISHDLGWSISELSGPLGLRVALFGLVAPFAGGLILVYGPRAILIASALLVIAGLLLVLSMNARWELWFGLGVLMGVAPGLTAIAMATTIATRWFTAHRGLVVGLLSANTATGQLIFLPPAAWIAQTYGWRAALLPLVLLNAALVVLFMLFSRDRPADVGLPPLGEERVLPDPPPPSGNVFIVSLAALQAASRSLVFWVVTFAFFICGLSSVGLMPHFVTFCGDFGVSPILSASLLATIGVFDLVGTIGSGWLSDRYDNRWLLASYYGFRGLSLFWLPNSGFSLFGLSLFAMLFGLDFVATVPPSVRLTAEEFGREQAPVVFGWSFAAHQLGAGAMAFGAGFSRDALSSYSPAFFVAGAACIAAAASFSLLRKGPARPAFAAATG
jgi:predicted MFS family arabinose efflux permease